MSEKILDREKSLDLNIKKLKGPEGSAALGEFLEGLVERYPERAYAPGVVDEINANRITYVAEHSGAYAGMWDGIRVGDCFSGRLLVVDPKYQHTNVVESLRTAMFNDFREARIMVYPFGQKRDSTPEHFEARQRALVRYYEKIGFKLDPDVSSGGDPVVPMIWRRSEMPPEQQL